MEKARIPTVRMACPEGRPIQLRYFCTEERKEIRISTGTRDQKTAEGLKRELEAKLLLGLEAKPKTMSTRTGPKMLWDEFRDQYRDIYLGNLKAADCIESRLDIAERIVRPKTLGDMNDRKALETLQAKLLSGEGRIVRSGRKRGEPAIEDSVRPRSAHTVKSTMATILAALNWAVRRGWLPSVPMIDKVKTSKLRAMKGRPITAEEFERMLEKTPAIVGPAAAESWRHVLRGLWSSALRLEELMCVSWTDENAIRPIWQRGRHPVLYIPASMQKNDTEEAIPLLPWFDDVLQETPEPRRSGWVFNPESLQGTKNRQPSGERPNADWVGRIISRIGKKAGVVVHSGDAKTQRAVKFASAHDLRRSCADRLLDAGVPAEVVTRILRHSSFETTRRHYAPNDVQKVAGKLQQALASEPTVPGYTSEGDLT